MRKFLRFLSLASLCCLVLPRITLAIAFDAYPDLVTSHDQWFEANSGYNVVMHVTITADVLGDTLQTFYINDVAGSSYAQDGTDIVSNSVRLWYVANDAAGFSTSTAQLAGVLQNYGVVNADPFNMNLWYSDTLNQLVVQGSALYVTVDITATPTQGVCCSFVAPQHSWDFAGRGPASQPGADLPVYPNPPATAYNLLTSYTAATGLEISHSAKTITQVSSNQTFYPLDFVLHNTGTPLTAPVFAGGITVTVKNQAGTIIAPNTTLQSIGLINKTTQVLLSSVATMPATATGIFIPLSVSITALADLQLQLVATVSSSPTPAGLTFKLEVSQASSVEASDAYTFKPVGVAPSGGDTFPMSSNLLAVFYSATAVDVYHTPVLEQNHVVLRGDLNVNPLNFTFSNPGTTGTSRADVTHITLAVTNGGGDPIAPSTVFSRLAISGGVLYGETTSMPTSGNLVTITLGNSYVPVPVYQPLTITVLADILPDASAVEFKLAVPGAAGITAQDANTTLPLLVRAAQASDPFPMRSNTIRIASSFSLAGRSLAPATLYATQRTSFLELTFSHPGPVDVGPLLLQGITITARDQAGNPLILADNCSQFFLTDSQGAQLAQATPLAGATSVFLNVSNLSVAPFTSALLRLEAQLAAHPASQTLSLGIVQSADIAASQPSDLTRQVYVTGRWPMLSTWAAVGGGEGELLLSNYPNPFAAGRSMTHIAYYLKKAANVTLRLYTLAGDQVASLADGEFQASGEQVKIWNGRTATGGVVKNGVYLLRVEAVATTTGESIVQIRKIAVVK